MLAPAAIIAARGLFCVDAKGPSPVAVLAVALLIPASWPNLDYYNWPTRKSAYSKLAFDFEQTYWGNALDAEVIADLNEVLPANARVKTLAVQDLSFPILQDWGVLRADLLFNVEPPYNAHLLQNRRGFWSNTEWYFFRERIPLATWGRGAGNAPLYGKVEPLVFLYDGAPPARRGP